MKRPLSLLIQSLPSILLRISKAIDQKGGVSLLVGGAVRDFFLQSPSKDLDVEIYNLPEKDLVILLKKFGKVSSVGKAFGVFKFSTSDLVIDFSLPRKESKTGKGHKGFEITPNPFMTFREAARRRDFTINAMGVNLIKEELIDPFKGFSDLEKRQLKVVDPKTFIEDPLRVLRAVQFTARFHLEVPTSTRDVIKSIVNQLEELPKERIYEELKKLLLKADQPSIGFQIADELGILEHFFPELKALQGVKQDAKWHPEGDVWQHNQMVIDQAANLRESCESENMKLMLAAVCHDFGKPATTEFVDGKWRSRNHEAEGVIPTENFLKRITNEVNLIETVKLLVKEHLKPALLYKADKVTNGAIRRLSLRVDIPLLLKVARADHFGRTTADALAKEFPAGDWLLQRYQNLSLHKPETLKPILSGRHLIEQGMTPGVEFGEILKAAFELQLDGKIQNKEEALNWLKNKIND